MKEKEIAEVITFTGYRSYTVPIIEDSMGISLSITKSIPKSVIDNSEDFIQRIDQYGYIIFETERITTLIHLN